MRILQINQNDVQGGAAAVAWNLHQAFLARGLGSYIAVANKSSDDPHVYRFSDYASGASRFLKTAAHRSVDLNSRYRGFGRISTVLNALADLAGTRESRKGWEVFSHPETWRLLRGLVNNVDIVHCHNLHGNYFDLRILSWLGRKVPVVVSLHDAWLLAGHCVHSLDCPHWHTGCVPCPDIGRSRAIRRDAAGENLRRKQRIYENSALYVTTACTWLMEKTRSSILAPAIADSRVIPNGVDLSVFAPHDRLRAREALGLPRDVKLLMTVGHGLRTNRCKDYPTLTAAAVLIARHFPPGDVVLLATGYQKDYRDQESVPLRFVPYLKDPRSLALYYAAADLLIHAARADTFPNAVLEAQACGTPVVATAVGGIPEQVKGLRPVDGPDDQWNQYPVDQATGILVPLGDAPAMAGSVIRLLEDPPVRRQLGENGVREVRERFSLERSVEALLTWYQEILAQRGAPFA